MTPGSHVFTRVSIGANARVILAGDTAIYVTGGPGVVEPLFMLGAGAIIYAGAANPLGAGAVPGTDGTKGADGDSGSWDWSTYNYLPHHPPTYTQPKNINGSNGTAATNGTTATGGGRLSNLTIRVEGNAVFGLESAIYLNRYKVDLASVNGGFGGDGGDGGHAGAVEEYRTSGDTTKPFYPSGIFDIVGGNGGNGASGGNGAQGIAGYKGGALTLRVKGDMVLQGSVEFLTYGADGGRGGRAGMGGFPGNNHYGIDTTGTYGSFGLNGHAGNGAPGGDGGPVDVYVAGNLEAIEPYNLIIAASGMGGGGGSGSNAAYGYYGSAPDTQLRSAPTPPGAASTPGVPGAVRIRVGRYMGASSADRASGAPSIDCFLYAASTSGQGGKGGDLGINWSSQDGAYFPGNAANGLPGGTGGSVELVARLGIANETVAAIVNGGNGGAGGLGGEQPGSDVSLRSGGVGANGGPGGTIVIKAPGADASLLHFDVSGGLGGKGGDGTVSTYTTGPKGADGAPGAAGTLSVQDTSPSGSPDPHNEPQFFPMTLKLETVPATLSAAPVGSTVVYRATFTNDAALAIDNFSLETDLLDAHTEAIVDSGLPTGSWNAASGRFKTTPITLAAGAHVVWEFSVRVKGPFAADTTIINGVTAKGSLGGSAELDHTLTGVTMSGGGVTFADDPLVTRSTRIRALHITELRQAIDTLRTRQSLVAFSWTDSPLSAGTTRVKAIHVAEMRTAIQEVYVALSRPLPSYSRSAVTAGMGVAAADIAELRTAVQAIW